MALDVVQTLRILMDFNACLNAAASLVILWLIYGLRLPMRGYVLLITSMTVCQFVFDGSLVMLFECPQTDIDCLNSCVFIASSFGIASQGWSLCIAVVVGYIIATRRHFDIDKWYPLMGVAIASSSASVGLIRVLASSAQTGEGFPISPRESIYLYDAMRYLEIFINLATLGVIFYHLRDMAVDQLPSSPIYVLAKKLMLYPAAQMLSRIGSTQYEDYYGVVFPTDSGGWSKQSVQAVLYSILTPLGGSLSLLIFLYVQPGACKLLVSVSTCSPIQEDPLPSLAASSRVSDSSPDKRSLQRSRSHSRSAGYEDSPSATSASQRFSDDHDGAFCSNLSEGAMSQHSSVRLGFFSDPSASPRNSLSTVFSAIQNEASMQVAHGPRSLVALSEEQLVEAIVSQAQRSAAIVKSSSSSALHALLLGDG